MKNIFLLSFVTIFLISCGNSSSNSSSMFESSSKRSDYISTCFEATPGGSSYKELCECSYDGGIALMTPEERTAFERDFTEIEDLKHTLSAPMKIFEAAAVCTEDLLK
jgi:hypothetical protein